MGIEIKAMETTTPQVEAPNPGGEFNLTPAMVTMINSEARRAVKYETESHAKYMAEIVKEVVGQTQDKLKEVEKLATNLPVLHVSIDSKPPKKLNSIASPVLGRMIANAKLGLNSLLVGPAGCGKTIAANQLAESLELAFDHVCCTAGASESWFFGRQTPNGFIEAPFCTRYREGGVFLADEMDAADANMLLAINTALANGSLFNPINGETITKHEKFVFIGCANTFGKGADHVYTGRNRLDGATLNRFICLEVNYSKEIEKVVCPDSLLRNKLQFARKKLLELKSDEIISTRTLEAAYLQAQSGVLEKEILESITLSWPDGLADQCLPKTTKKKKDDEGNEDDLPF